MSNIQTKSANDRREQLFGIIFGADTAAGKTFDVILMLAIVASVGAVVIESVEDLNNQYGRALTIIEWVFTALFTIEYVVRLLIVRRPWRYAISFFGIVDLLAILPSYLGLILPNSESLMVIRSLRLLRVFRVLRLARFLGEAEVLRRALKASAHKIVVFLGAVMTLILILGTLMYLVEGKAGTGFDNIPQAVYWAIVTMTTVGYGDIAPGTVVGKIIASTMMLIGYGILAVPTGIVTVELSSAARKASNIERANNRSCPSCQRNDHEHDAVFCRICGSRL